MRTRLPSYIVVLSLSALSSLALQANPAHAFICRTCDAYFNCETTVVGALACWSGNIGGVMSCAMAGACPGGDAGGGGGGGDDGMIPRRRSPMFQSVAWPGDVDELRLYWLTIPVDEAILKRLDDRAVVIHGVADIERPHSILHAVANRCGVAHGALRLANAESLVGPPTLAASFVAPNGGGYTIVAGAISRGARVGLCRIEARQARERLASETLEPGDLLVIPMRLHDEPCVMALTVAPPFGMDPGGRAEERRVRTSFRETGHRLGQEGGHRGFRVELLPEPIGCR